MQALALAVQVASSAPKQHLSGELLLAIFVPLFVVLAIINTKIASNKKFRRPLIFGLSSSFLMTWGAFNAAMIVITAIRS